MSSAIATQDSDAETLERLVKVYRDMPDSYEALKAAKALLAKQKSSKNVKGQANALLMLGEIHFTMNNLEDALTIEQEALAIFKSLDDRESQESVKEALSAVYSKRGDVSAAPNRDKGLAALGELVRAIEAADKTRFSEAMERCRRMNSVSEADIDEKLGEALENNYLPAARLFKEVLNFEGLMPETKGICVPNRFHYMGFRTQGGLHYGPTFKCVQGVVINQGQDEVYSPINLTPGLPDIYKSGGDALGQGAQCHDGWEYEIAYHPAVLDAIVQMPMSNAMVGHAVHESSRCFAKTFKEQEENQRILQQALGGGGYPGELEH